MKKQGQGLIRVRREVDVVTLYPQEEWQDAYSFHPAIARAIARQMIEIANQIDRDNENPESLLGTP